MPDYEQAMRAYVRLARLSDEKQQPQGRDRFLLLAGQAACRAGWLEVADCCRTLTLRANARHLLSRTASFPDALRDPDASAYFARLASFCSFEQAEHLLRGLDQWPEPAEPGTAGELVLRELQQLTIPAVTSQDSGSCD